MIPAEAGRARPSQAEGQGEAETLRLSPRFQAELIVLYIPGRAEGRGPRTGVRGPNDNFDSFLPFFLLFLMEDSLLNRSYSADTATKGFCERFREISR